MKTESGQDHGSHLSDLQDFEMMSEEMYINSTAKSGPLDIVLFIALFPWLSYIYDIISHNRSFCRILPGPWKEVYDCFYFPLLIRLFITFRNTQENENLSRSYSGILYIFHRTSLTIPIVSFILTPYSRPCGLMAYIQSRYTADNKHKYNHPPNWPE